MFTGIVETVGKIVHIEREKENVTFSVAVGFLDELKIDQSIAHNGVCLTVNGIADGHYTVTAILETLQRTHLGKLKTGDGINLERCMKLGDRLDGHIVQGHVDTTGTVKKIIPHEGSREYFITYSDTQHITVPKGSITVNGVSLTVVHSTAGEFSVAIIPYTYEHTTFHDLKEGDTVNLEFDIVGKYIAQLLQHQQS